MKKENKEVDFSYATLLKRKRQENNLTLEELSSGVCTPSYLCRIENEQVKVGDEYYEHLFKKLNLDFDTLKKTKITDLPKRIIHFFLAKDLEGLKDLASYCLSSPFYAKDEYTLLLFCADILAGDIELAVTDLNILEEGDRLMNDEKEVFNLLKAHLAFRQNKYEEVFKAISYFNNYELKDYEIKLAFLDLICDVSAYLEIPEIFFKYYKSIKELYLFKDYLDLFIKQEANFVYLSTIDKNDSLIALLNQKYKDANNSKKEIAFLILKIKMALNSAYDYKLDEASSLKEHLLILIYNIKSEKKIKQKGIINPEVSIYYNIYQSLQAFLTDSDLLANYYLLKASLRILIEEGGDLYFGALLLEVLIGFAEVMGKYKDVLNLYLQLKSILDATRIRMCAMICA